MGGASGCGSIEAVYILASTSSIQGMENETEYHQMQETPAIKQPMADRGLTRSDVEAALEILVDQLVDLVAERLRTKQGSDRGD